LGSFESPATFGVLGRNIALQKGELSGVELHADSAVLGDPFKGWTMAGTIEDAPSFFLVLVLVLSRASGARARNPKEGRWVTQFAKWPDRAVGGVEYEYRLR